jgi:hypothetical protein
MTDQMYQELGFEMQDCGFYQVYRKTAAPFQADVEKDMFGKITWKVYHIRNAMGGKAEVRGKARKLANALRTADQALTAIAGADTDPEAGQAPEPAAIVPNRPIRRMEMTQEQTDPKATYTKVRKNETADEAMGFDYAICVDGFVYFWYRENPAGEGYYAELAYGVAEQLGPEKAEFVNGLYQFVKDLKESAIRVALLLAGDESIELWNGVAYPNQRV